MSAELLLEVRDLGVGYGHVEAVRAVSFELRAGEIVSIIGPNGAGKTTILSSVMGLVPRSGGEVRFLGEPTGEEEVEELTGRGMALVPETRELFGSMSVEDNLLLGAYRRRHARSGLRAAFDRVFGLFPRLAERRRQEADTLSGGERQMLALGRALMGEPQLLMLDEPSLGLAPLIVRDIFRIIAELRATGVGILLVEQNARAALETSDYAYVLETGNIAAEGKAADLARDPVIVASYLGIGRHAA